MIEEKAIREGETQIRNQNKIKETKTRIRVEKDLINRLREEAKIYRMSLNSYVNFVLNSFVKKEEILFKETVSKPEKREVESRVYFTSSEAEFLKKHAELNEWSISREVRYRTVSSLAKKPKLSGEELRAIYSVRASVNVLGANVNRLIRNGQVLSDNNIVICEELIGLMKELKGKIDYLEKCSHTYFKLDVAGGKSGG